MISVIIPIFNSAAKGLSQCLQLVASQTYADIQVIMVDDGSTDASQDICKEWAAKDPRFFLFCQKQQGPAAARNTGLKYAKGSAIAFVDSDDTPDVKLLQKLHEAMLLSSAELVIANYYERGTIQRLNVVGPLGGDTLLKGILDYHSPLCKALYAKLFRTDVLDGIWFSNLHTGEDIDFLSRIYLRVNHVTYVDRPLYNYNLHRTSIMHTQTANDYMDILTCYESIVDRVGNAAKELEGLALDALMRKVVSTRYRNRKFGDVELKSRLNRIQTDYFNRYLYCKNGNLGVKIGLMVCLLMPWLYTLIMNYKER